MEAGGGMSPFQPIDEATVITPELAEAVRLTKAQPVAHVSRSTCGVCGGQGCDQCRYCDCRDCSYTPEYARSAVRNWRPSC